MPALQGVIISFRDTLVMKGQVDTEIFSEVEKLIGFLKLRAVNFAVLANDDWYLTDDKGKRYSLVERLRNRWGHFEYFCSSLDSSVPRKPRADATKHVIKTMDWDPDSVVYIGASEIDAFTATNGDLLFLRATWFGEYTDYGLPFSSPLDICRFIDTFCLREHWWFMAIEDNPFRFYSLATFSTYKRAHELYSQDARNAAKFGRGHPEFWLAALVTSVYFTGLHQEMNYIAVVPGHRQGCGNNVMGDALDLFAKCFRAKYLPDLVVRHTKAQKMQYARTSQIPIDHRTQLNSIRLERLPLKSPSDPYKTPPLKSNKTVLVIDDFCTNGYSMEAVRAYIEQTGANVIMVSWLKTINSDILRLGQLPKFNPYESNTFENATVTKVYGYHQYATDHLASEEIDEMFRQYEDWSWPSGV